MNQLRLYFGLLGMLVFSTSAYAQKNARELRIEPFVNRVFIEEQGQFHDKLERQGALPTEPILYALENAEFNAYFTSKGVHFRFAERKTIPKIKRVRVENEPDERGVETTWHTIDLLWQNANADPQVVAQEKVHEYYNYSGLGSKPNINFVPAFNELAYKNIYDGVDMIFELPEEGGIKYRFEIASGTAMPEISLKWSNVEALNLDDQGNLLIKSTMAIMKDLAPSAKTFASDQTVPVQYKLEDNVVRFELNATPDQLAEGIIIDPWVINTSFPVVNRAHDIQEDAAGNIVVHGNHTNYQVQKYNAAGVLQWTYVTASTFLGDIAVDNPGNVYIVGGYSAGKRQKLNPAGVQVWQFSGLVEEWRLAFNYSKTVLVIGGYFVNPAGNNLAKLDMNTGAISNQIVYGLETRCIATDCNGDMYSLHVTFGVTADAPGNVLLKTNADFTPADSVPSGFLLAEAEIAAGYAPNPTYSANIFQGFNGLVVSGPYVYTSDGVSLRRSYKTNLAFVNSTTITGGVKLGNSGLASDQCGNIYAGTQTGIIKYDSLLNYIETIATPGAVYDIIYGQNDELLVSGDGFIGTYAINCVQPPPLTAITNNACDGTGSIEINVAGGLSPYTFEWQPGGLTGNPITGLPSGVYTYTVNDAFCRTYIDSAEVYQIPVPTFTSVGSNTVNLNPNSVCLGETMQFGDNSTATDGNIISWNWDFGDGNTSTDPNPSHTYTNVGSYNVQLVVTTDLGCTDSTLQQITVDPVPDVNFSATAACFGVANEFTDATVISSGNIVSWSWDFGDGNTTSTQTPTHQYNATGTFATELIATSANGCFNSFQVDVDVYDLPQPDFTFPSTCVNDPTDLADNSIDGDWPINSWTWNTDGQTLTGSTVQHTFSTTGAFSVQLVVEDQFGCIDSVSQQLTISVRPDIALSVSDDCAMEQFVFVNTSSIPTGSIDVYEWDMDDGNTYTTASPTNTYVDHGIYNVTLHLESDLGCAADTAFQVEVYPNPVAGLTWQNQCEGTAISLTETTSVPGSGQLVLSDWNMGNGTMINDSALTSYSYAAFGDYSISLSVETQDGCTDSETFVVSSHAMPVADFNFTDICETDSVLFADQSVLAQGNIVGWQWDFGNGQTSNSQVSAYQTYAADGIYPVQLTVTSDSGCVHVKDDVIEIFPSPIADFMFDSVCFPLAIQWQDLSDPNGAYNINQWAWEFSDGQTSLSASPQVSFPQFGAYGATLTITNQAGCKDEISLGDALVHPVPVADYYTELKHCFGEGLIFTDQSIIEVLSDDQIISWQYDFGDGDTEVAPSGSHYYASPGLYHLELSVTSNHGCEHTITNEVEVYPLPDVAFDADPKEGCDPLFVQFTDQSSILAPYSLQGWSWNLGELGATPSSQNPYYLYDTQNLGAHDFATYNVSLQVTSANGCTSSLMLNDFITVHPVPYALFSTDPDQIASIVHPLFQFTDLSTVNVTSWQWSFGDGFGATVQNPNYTYLEVGNYVVTLAVATDFGCQDTISYSVIVEPQFTFYVPNAFTPNNDGINDLFFGSGEAVTDYNMQIFDRWGEVIFESNSMDHKWDGIYKGLPAEAGQYVYKFQIRDWKGDDHQYSGGVNLLR